MSNPDSNEAYRRQVALAATDETLVRRRVESAQFVARVFLAAGVELHVAGHLLGDDRKSGQSPFGHGSDEVVAVSILLRIAGQLVSGIVNLFEGGLPYAAAALLRQIVEIEYLAWAFETRDGDAERWLRSDRKAREDFFSPAKLRKAANGKFGSNDYGRHCEFGGHPVPNANSLLSGDRSIHQLLLVDLLGHAGRIWNHLASWAEAASYGEPLLKHQQSMSARLSEWWNTDPLVNLPPPFRSPDGV